MKRTRVRGLVWLALGALAWAGVTGCEDKVPEPEPPPRPAATADKETPPPPKELVKEDLKVGDGPTAESGDEVEVHYTGRLFKNGKKFDSSLDNKKPFPFTIGQGDVIKGWDQGVVGMKVGGKRKLTIPADLAYGDDGQPPKIPPKAALVFEIELLKIKGKDDAGAGGSSAKGPAEAAEGDAKKGNAKKSDAKKSDAKKGDAK